MSLPLPLPAASFARPPTSARTRRPLATPPRPPRTRAARRAFEEQVLPYRKDMYASALRYTRNPRDAEDLVQETLLRAFAAWSSFVPGSNCRAWLLRILANSFINIYRRRRRHRQFTHETGDDAVIALYGDAPEKAADPAAELVDAALSDEVTRALATLLPDYREVVVLADLHGMRYRDIATLLRVPIGTVMSRLFRARRQLEEQLAPYAAADYGIKRAA